MLTLFFFSLTPLEVAAELLVAVVAGRTVPEGRLEADPGSQRSPGHSRARSSARGGCGATGCPHVCSPGGSIREKGDERGRREQRGAPSAFPSFQGSLEPLNEIIGRNWGWTQVCASPPPRSFVRVMPLLRATIGLLAGQAGTKSRLNRFK